MISIAPEILYVGYLSGVVKVWHTEVGNPQFIFGKEYEQPPVRSIAFSPKHRKVIVGYEGTFENQHGRFVKLEQNVLRVYNPDASGHSEGGLLEPFLGTCFAIGVVDRLDLVLAISSEESGLYGWNLISHQLELKINLPRIDSHPQVITQLLVIERGDCNYLVLGSSDGTVLISQVGLEEKSIVWKPVKKLVLYLDGNYAIEYLRYEDRIDTLVLGNTFATATFISNFFRTGLGEELTEKMELKIDQ
jgi:WD40 repeat protein